MIYLNLQIEVNNKVIQFINSILNLKIIKKIIKLTINLVN